MSTRAEWKRLTTSQKQRILRDRATAAELTLKNMLDAHPLTAGKFVHQASVAGYFPDFAFAHAKLIIELDGAVHAGRAARRKDSKRSARLRSKGWRVIRFWNSELRSPAVVMKAILVAIRSD
jgi:very-short-patch-repair endonuclease